MDINSIPLSLEAQSIHHVWQDPALRETAMVMWDTAARQAAAGKEIDPFERFRVTREEAARINAEQAAIDDSLNAQAPSAEDQAIAGMSIDKIEGPETEEPDSDDDVSDEDRMRSAFDDRDESVPEGYDELDPEDAEVELVVPKRFGQTWQNYAKMLEVYWNRVEYLRIDEDSIEYYDTYFEEAKAGFALLDVACRTQMPFEVIVENMFTLDRFSTVVNKKVLEVINRA